MTDAAKIEEKFWKHLRSDMTVFLGCEGAPPRPMTAIVDGDDNSGPLWFFGTTDSDLGRVLATNNKPGMMTFVNKGWDLWASASGTLSLDTDPARVARLWNPAVAAWYDGKEAEAVKKEAVKAEEKKAHVRLD